MIANICQTCQIAFTKPNNPNRVYKYCSVKCNATNPDRIKIHTSKMKGRKAWNKGVKGFQPWMNISGLNGIGNTPWNKNKKGLQVAWNKDKPNPLWVKEGNPNWKGGVTPINEKIRKTIEYTLWRTAVFMRDEYTCTQCGADKGGNLEADHIKPFSLYPELRFAIDNGRTLCHDCHTQTDTYLNKGRWIKRILVSV